MARPCYQSTEMLNKQVPLAMSSPFTAVSRNDTPSPGWPHDIAPNHTGLPSMISQHNAISHHGLWSSTPASPVSFPQNAVPDGYMRGQDHQFVKPRPQPRMPFVSSGKPSPPTGIYNDRVLIRRAPDNKPVGPMVSNKPTAFRYGQSATNGSASPSIIHGPIGDRSLVNSSHSPSLLDQWTPWNQQGERCSPDLPPPQAPATNFFGAPSYSLHNILNDKANDPWESSTVCEKPNLGPTNPFGPIGSNLTRRSSTAISHAPFDQPTDGSRSGEQQMWAYNPTF